MHGKYQDDKNCSLTGKVISGAEYFKNIYLALPQPHKKVARSSKEKQWKSIWTDFHCNF